MAFTGVVDERTRRAFRYVTPLWDNHVHVWHDDSYSYLAYRQKTIYKKHRHHMGFWARGEGRVGYLRRLAVVGDIYYPVPFTCTIERGSIFITTQNDIYKLDADEWTFCL